MIDDKDESKSIDDKSRYLDDFIEQNVYKFNSLAKKHKKIKKQSNNKYGDSQILKNPDKPEEGVMGFEEESLDESIVLYEKVPDAM